MVRGYPDGRVETNWMIWQEVGDIECVSMDDHPTGCGGRMFLDLVCCQQSHWIDSLKKFVPVLFLGFSRQELLCKTYPSTSKFSKHEVLILN
jgi:hypothetical protein